MCTTNKTEQQPTKKATVDIVIPKRHKIKAEQKKQHDKRNKPALFNGIREFYALFDTDEKCLNHLESIRWKNGVYCPHCGNIESMPLEGKRSYMCNDCFKTFDVTTATILEKGRVSLADWFSLIYLENSFIGGVTGGELERQMPLCRKTVTKMVGKLREYGYNQNCFSTNVETENGEKVFMLDTMVRDGEDRNRQVHRKRSYYGGNDITYILLIAQEGGNARGYVTNSVDGKTVLPIIYNHIPTGATVHTDEHGSFNPLNELYNHCTVNHKEREFGATNRVEGWNSFFQTGLAKFRNSISSLYTYRYVNAAIFRYNTRYMNEAEKLELVLENIFANPVDSDKPATNYKRDSLLVRERARIIRIKEHKEKMQAAKTDKDKLEEINRYMNDGFMTGAKVGKQELKDFKAEQQAREQQAKEQQETINNAIAEGIKEGIKLELKKIKAKNKIKSATLNSKLNVIKINKEVRHNKTSKATRQTRLKQTTSKKKTSKVKA